MITNQYDQMVMCDTAQKSGGDAAIIRIHNTNKAIAVSVDSPLTTARHTLSREANRLYGKLRNLVSVGAKPIAITNCLNFGNPENPEIMGEFAECLLELKKLVNF